ncbi:hypothetical protein U0070_027337 [Myodes glareolus]|uniref:Uncharacterized protein n=1 Tax=Myodes glareolus TaxID=447135 RepID=A0AAW0I2H3_MYOGA
METDLGYHRSQELFPEFVTRIADNERTEVTGMVSSSPCAEHSLAELGTGMVSSSPSSQDSLADLDTGMVSSSSGSQHSLAELRTGIRK